MAWSLAKGRSVECFRHAELIAHGGRCGLRESLRSRIPGDGLARQHCAQSLENTRAARVSSSAEPPKQQAAMADNGNRGAVAAVAAMGFGRVVFGIVNETKPPLEQVVAAVQARAKRETRRLLRAWSMPLRIIPLPNGPAWLLPFKQWGAWGADVLHALQALPFSSHGSRLFLDSRHLRHVAVQELWDAGCHDIIDRRVSGALEVYDDWTYLIWGRHMARAGRTIEAGIYLLLSGLYDATEASHVLAFKQLCQSMAQNQVSSLIPRACHHRSARARFSERVFRDLADLPCPRWWLKRPSA